jgi:hypothetical protein
MNSFISTQSLSQWRRQFTVHAPVHVLPIYFAATPPLTGSIAIMEEAVPLTILF